MNGLWRVETAFQPRIIQEPAFDPQLQALPASLFDPEPHVCRPAMPARAQGLPRPEASTSRLDAAALKQRSYGWAGLCSEGAK